MNLSRQFSLVGPARKMVVVEGSLRVFGRWETFSLSLGVTIWIVAMLDLFVGFAVVMVVG